MRWPLRAHRRRCHATGLVLWLLTAQLISCSHAWLFALRGAETPSALAPSALTFENAYQSTFHDAPFATAAAEQYDRLIAWLPQLPPQLTGHVNELSMPGVAPVLTAASRLAQASRLDDATLASALEEIAVQLEQLSPTIGYPLTRRVVVGALLKQRAAGDSLPQAAFKQMDRILRQLFTLHRTSASRKGAVQFFHISKSGGTNMCMAAESNGCLTEGFDERLNCLVREFHDHPRWATYGAHKFVQHSMHQKTNTPWFVNYGVMRKVEMTCAQRAAYLKEKKWNFYANEFTVPDGELGICNEFVNLIIFREPIQRLSSQISWIQKLYKALHNTTDIGQAFRGRTSSFWERLVPAAVSNYYSRSLLGPHFFTTPVLSVNVTHLQVAMLKVLQHDLLMILEQKDFNDLVLHAGLGWRNSIKDDKIRSSSDLKNEIAMPADYERLISRNQPDVEVHKFAQALQLLDVMLFKYMVLAEPDIQAAAAQSQCGYVTTPAK